MVNDCLVMVMDGNSMISLIKEKGLDECLEYIRGVRELLLEDNSQQMVLILTNMQAIITDQRKKRRVSLQPPPHSIRNPFFPSRKTSSPSCTSDCSCGCVWWL